MRRTDTDTDATAGTDWFSELASAAVREGGRERRLALVERSAAEGEMTPLHRRDEDETYRVLDGEVTFFVGGEVVVAHAGDVVVAPSGVARTLCGGTGGARWLVLTRVDALERFVDFGRARTRLRSPRWTPQDLAALAGLAAANGIELLGTPGSLPR